MIENNLADIMTESFGTCERYATDSQVAGVTALAEQAAAQGITYLSPREMMELRAATIKITRLWQPDPYR